MSTEKCELCNEDCTPWSYVNGHICIDCSGSISNIHNYRRNNEWVSVKDRLPEQSGYYLCTYVFDNHRFYYDRWFWESEKRFATTDNITHWMPLPEPPNET